jgi:phosphoribosylpyrophosphate synthetase
LLLNGARAKLMAESVADVFVTDTIELRPEGWPRLHAVSVAPLLAEAVRRVTSGELVGGLA